MRKLPAQHFREGGKLGLFTGTPGIVRMSTAARMLREIGRHGDASEIEREARIAAPWCPQCGRKLEDPVVGMLNTPDGPRMVYACPHCSGPDILAQWEAEGSTLQ